MSLDCFITTAGRGSKRTTRGTEDALLARLPQVQRRSRRAPFTGRPLSLIVASSTVPKLPSPSTSSTVTDEGVSPPADVPNVILCVGETCIGDQAATACTSRRGRQKWEQAPVVLDPPKALCRVRRAHLAATSTLAELLTRRRRWTTATARFPARSANEQRAARARAPGAAKGATPAARAVVEAVEAAATRPRRGRAARTSIFRAAFLTWDTNSRCTNGSLIQQAAHGKGNYECSVALWPIPRFSLAALPRLCPRLDSVVPPAVSTSKAPAPHCLFSS